MGLSSFLSTHITMNSIEDVRYLFKCFYICMGYERDKGMIEYVLHSCAPVISEDTLHSKTAAYEQYIYQ